MHESVNTKGARRNTHARESRISMATFTPGESIHISSRKIIQFESFRISTRLSE